MLLGWIDLIRGPFNKRNDFVSVDAARSYPNNHPKNYEMITSPPSTTYAMPKTPDPLLAASPTRAEAEERPSQFPPHSPPSPSSQYTNDYFGHNGGKEGGGRHLSFSLPTREADYKSPKLSFSTPRPPSAGRRSFSLSSPPLTTRGEDSHARYQQPSTQMPTQPGRMSPARPFPPPSEARESAGSTFSSAYDWDPTTTYAPPTTTAYSRPDAV